MRSICFIFICLFLSACPPPGAHHDTIHEKKLEAEPEPEPNNPPNTNHPQALCVLQENICEQYHASYAGSASGLHWKGAHKDCMNVLVRGEQACTYHKAGTTPDYYACMPITGEHAPCLKASEDECGKGDYHLCEIDQ